MREHEILAILKGAKPKLKPKRKTAKQQVRDERERVLSEIRAAMIDKKRSIPKEWERGFMAAVSVIEGLNL